MTVQDTPAGVLIIADDAEARLAAHAAAAGAGAHVLKAVSSGEGIAAIDALIGADAIFYEASAAVDSQLVEHLIARIDAAAEAGIARGVVVVPPVWIDMAAATAVHQDITLLSEPALFDRQSALALACLPRRMVLNDVRNDEGLSRLVQLSEEVGRIARSLAKLSDGASEVLAPVRGPDLVLPPLDSNAPPVTPAMVRMLLRIRRAREQFFPAELFSDPAWDMLLDLYAAQLEQQRVSVSSLCIAAAVPSTTALRWIKTMTEAGLFVRRADATDGRRIFIELGGKAAQAMTGYFQLLAGGALGRI